jgi:hypothetical protein
MWSVDDAQMRLLLLQHLATRYSPENACEFRAAGVNVDLLHRLRQLTASDMSLLAAARQPLVWVELDEPGLQSALRALEGIIQAKALETYFIRHGASPRMMRALFSLSYEVTYLRRRAHGVPAPRSRLRLPPLEIRGRIWRTWRALGDVPPRLAYHRLHLTYPQFSIALLEAVLREERE